jgi:hypothetical protein
MRRMQYQDRPSLTYENLYRPRSPSNLHIPLTASRISYVWQRPNHIDQMVNPIQIISEQPTETSQAHHITCEVTPKPENKNNPNPKSPYYLLLLLLTLCAIIWILFIKTDKLNQ